MIPAETPLEAEVRRRIEQLSPEDLETYMNFVVGVAGLKPGQYLEIGSMIIAKNPDGSLTGVLPQGLVELYDAQFAQTPLKGALPV